MKRKASILALLVVVAPLSLFADAISTKITLDTTKPQLMFDGAISIPVSIKNVSTVRACEFTFLYAGEITSAEFVPTDYFHDPVVLPARIDRGTQTVRIAMAASEKVVTRQTDGIIGRIVVTGNVDPQSLELAEARLLDEDYRLQSLLDNGSEQETSSSDSSPSPPTNQILETKLFQSYPNPANPTTTISFSLKEMSHVSLRVYDVSGKLVRILVDERLVTDNHSVVWDAKDGQGNAVSSGIYFYRLKSGSYVDQKKLVILK